MFFSESSVYSSRNQLLSMEATNKRNKRIVASVENNFLVNISVVIIDYIFGDFYITKYQLKFGIIQCFTFKVVEI